MIRSIRLLFLNQVLTVFIPSLKFIKQISFTYYAKHFEYLSGKDQAMKLHHKVKRLHINQPLYVEIITKSSEVLSSFICERLGKDLI